jgi:hypothetical protein
LARGRAMGAEIRNFYTPHTLYRYRKLVKAERELDAIVRATLYCASLNLLNDPMEGNYKKLTNPDSAEVKQERIFSNSLQDQIRTLGICSFSETNNDNMMWAHYADEYRGICVAYRFSSLRHALSESVYFTRMNYRDDAPPPRKKTSSAEDEIYRLLSCKGYKWQYEREWRMFSKPGATCYKNAKIVTDVFLGSRVTETNRNLFIKKLMPLNIRIYTMSLEGYKVSFNRVKPK